MRFMLALAMIGLIALAPLEGAVADSPGPAQTPGLKLSGSVNLTMPSPSPPAPASTPMFHFYKPVLYVYAMAPDAPTSNRIALETARQWRSDPKVRFDSDRYTIVSAPATWTIADLANQCAIDPHAMLGALFYFNTYSVNSGISYIVLNYNRLEFDADVALIECTNTGSMNVAWTANNVSASDHERSVPVLSVALLATVVKALFPPAPQQTMTATTTTFASPNPIPAQGYTSQTVATSAVATNDPNDNAFIAGAFLTGASGLTAFGTSAQIPGINPDSLSQTAARRLAETTLAKFKTDLHDNRVDCFRCAQWFVAPGPTPKPGETETPLPIPTASPTPDYEAATPSAFVAGTPWPDPPPNVSLADLNAFLTAFANSNEQVADDGSVRTYRQIVYGLSGAGDSYYTFSKAVSFPRLDSRTGASLCTEIPQRTASSTFLPPEPNPVAFEVPAGLQGSPARPFPQMVFVSAPHPVAAPTLGPPTCASLTAPAIAGPAPAPSPLPAGAVPATTPATTATPSPMPTPANAFTLQFQNQATADYFVKLMAIFNAPKAVLAFTARNGTVHAAYRYQSSTSYRTFAHDGPKYDRFAAWLRLKKAESITACTTARTLDEPVRRRLVDLDDTLRVFPSPKLDDAQVQAKCWAP